MYIKYKTVLFYLQQQQMLQGDLNLMEFAKKKIVTDTRILWNFTYEYSAKSMESSIGGKKAFKVKTIFDGPLGFPFTVCENPYIARYRIFKIIFYVLS